MGSALTVLALALAFGFAAPAVFASAPLATITIPDNAIMIHVTSSTSAMITWNTSVATSTTLNYVDSNYSNATVQYSNLGDGFTMFHTITISGIDLSRQHSFSVGGAVQQTGVLIASNPQSL